jgi:hypothetical protein
MANNVSCDVPTVFDSAVNVVVLPYDYALAGQPLSKTVLQMSVLVQLDALFSNLKYRSIGVLQVKEEERPGGCAPEKVIDRLLGNSSGAARTLHDGQGLVVLWGKVYEEGGDLYVQSYLRFLRKGGAESLDVPVSDARLRATLPSQALAFPPQHLTTKDVADISSEFSRAIVIRERPDDSSAPVAASILADESTSIAYGIDRAEEEWVHVVSKGRPSGWVRATAEMGKTSLRRRMPELYFLDAVVGYLESRISSGADGRPSGREIAWVEEALRGYEEGTAGGRSEPAPLAVGQAMLGFLHLLGKPSEDDLVTAQKSFDSAAERLPYNVAALNLSATGRLSLFFRGSSEAAKGLAGRIGKPVVQSSMRDLVRTYARNPQDPVAKGNLESLDRLLDSKPPALRAMAGEVAAVQGFSETFKAAIRTPRKRPPLPVPPPPRDP